MPSLTVFVIEDARSPYLDVAVIIAANDEEALQIATSDGMVEPTIRNRRSEPGIVERFIE
jgi:hypothetical protein